MHPQTQSVVTYLRTTRNFTSTHALQVDKDSYVRHISSKEATNLEESVRKRNAFSRHSAERSFYVLRAAALGGQTVIELRKLGNIKDVWDSLVLRADELERLFVLSTTLASTRLDLHRKLGVSKKHLTEFDFAYDSEFAYLRSRSRQPRTASSIRVDKTFSRRFEKAGFATLWSALSASNSLASKLAASTSWLYESRIEPRPEAAIVKTAISLETLFVFSESDPLNRVLSERTSFLLTDDPARRQAISRIVRAFYAARSAVVHGGRKKSRGTPSCLLEAMDRLIVLCLLKLSANTHVWPKYNDDFASWIERERWGCPTSLATPFESKYLVGALTLADSGRNI